MDEKRYLLARLVRFHIGEWTYAEQQFFFSPREE